MNKDYRSTELTGGKSSEFVHALVFEGGECSGSWPEKLILDIRHETSLDQIEMLLATEEINSVTVITDYDRLQEFVRAHREYRDKLFLIDTREQGPDHKSKDFHNHNYTRGDDLTEAKGRLSKTFHYGETLKRIINENKLEKVLICGGGATPLLSRAEISHICKRVIEEDSLVYSNNPQSGDVVAFTPASAVNLMEPPESDNALVMGLRYDVGLKFDLVPFSAGVLFDIDTPTEIFFLLNHPGTKKRVEKVLERLSQDEREIIERGWNRFVKTKDVLSGHYEDVVLIGRVSGSIMAYINENIKVRLRVFSEERGMKAMGRVEAKEVKSILGYFIEEVGIDRFFDHLESLGRAVIMDSRVIFHHFGAGDITADRFYSDLYVPEKIQSDFVRAFTKRAAKAKVPVLLGGHSLVSGGMYSLVEDVFEGSKT